MLIVNKQENCYTLIHYTAVYKLHVNFNVIEEIIFTVISLNSINETRYCLFIIIIISNIMSNVHLLQIEILDIFPCIPFMIFSSYEFMVPKYIRRVFLTHLLFINYFWYLEILHCNRMQKASNFLSASSDNLLDMIATCQLEI